MSSDPAFKLVPKGQSTFLVWRIEKMAVVPVPKEQFGTFYNGDSYIILSVKETKGALDSRIHFWLGSETTQDEAGVAAYKTVELDDMMGGAPVQHREVEGSETKTFLNYFKSKGGVKILKGGVASGFNHVEQVQTHRLFHVKGHHNVRMREVDISWDSINDGDAFILDLGKVIFVWLGKQCRRSERLKALEISRSLRNDRGGGDIIPIENGEEDAMTAGEKKHWEQHLPLSSKVVKSASEAAPDEEFEKRVETQIKLYICSDEGGTLKVTEKKSGPLVKADLDSSESYIIDNGPNGVWVWVGKQSSATERKEAMRNALGFISKKKYPGSTQVVRVVETGEPADFKALFKQWPVPMVSSRPNSYKGRIAKTVQTKFDASTLHANPSLASEVQMADDGTGKVKIWRIEGSDMIDLPAKFYGQFFGGDCYIILYTYLVNNREHFIVYFWLGSKSSQDEKGTCALRTIEVDDSLGGSAVQVRVVQGKEPNHFMAIFQGKMMIFEGGTSRSTGNLEDGPGDTYMMHVRGTSILNTKAVQVPLLASSLNSNDVFVVFAKSTLYVWTGKGSTGDEREMAKKVAGISNREAQMMFEGQEKEDFWKVLGGKTAYASDKHLQDDSDKHPARLFQVSNASGRVKAEEVLDFIQDDLVPEDVMILDQWDSVFIWVGNGANATEKDQAIDLTRQYIETDPAGRDADTPIIKVKQGFEPPNFTGFFGVWDTEIWSKGKTFEEMKRELGEDNMGISVVKENSTENGTIGFSEVAKYPLSQLTVSIDQLPAGVNPSGREIYLAEDEFEQVFKVKYADFIALPQWKQQRLKKDKGLF